jgi:hypothetical protein
MITRRMRRAPCSGGVGETVLGLRILFPFFLSHLLSEASSPFDRFDL